MANQGEIILLPCKARQSHNIMTDEKKAYHYFDYELRPQIGEAGTYFYHSHVDFQSVSVAGPLIVTENDGLPPYSYDDEKTLLFTEVFNQTEEVIMKGLLAPEADLGWCVEYTFQTCKL